MKQPFEVPATFATQVSIAMTDAGWRLSFGEPVDTTTNTYHVAVFLPIRTALQLTDLMQQSAQKQKVSSQDVSS